MLRIEAADWVATLHADLPSSASEAREYESNCRQFIEWVTRSADHVAVFLRADETFCRLGGLSPMDRVDVEELRKRYSRDLQDQLRAASPKASARTPARRFRTWAIAASILVMLAGTVALETAKHFHEYETAVGEQLNVQLPDGSLMLLNTRSQARFDFSSRQRLVYLTKGEALFEVEHDAKRPFIVLTSSARVRAVGTRFNVYAHMASSGSDGGATTVSVLDGVVQIAPLPVVTVNPLRESFAAPATPESAAGSASPARLAAGEQASISRHGVTRQSAADVADAVAWRDRVLVFQGTPLTEVAAEYNRYNTAQVRIEDDEIAQLQMSGTYSADRPQNLVRYLEEAFPVEVTRDGKDWIIRKR